jgi:hypothetical protein
VDVECQEPLESHVCEASSECGLVTDVDACVTELEACVEGLDNRDAWRSTAYGCLAFTAECDEDCMAWLLSCPPELGGN